MISELNWLLSILVGGGNIRPDKTLVIISITYVHPMRVRKPFISSTVSAQIEIEQGSLCYLKFLTSSCLRLSTGTNTPHAQKSKGLGREMHFQRTNCGRSVTLLSLAICVVSLHLTCFVYGTIL